MSRFSAFIAVFVLMLLLVACSPSERERLDVALSGDCPAKIDALERLLPELKDEQIKLEAEKSRLQCLTELDRVKAVKLFEDPEKNLEELLKFQKELRTTGRAGLLENAYNGFISKLFAEGELERASKLYELLLKRGLVHATSTTYAKAFINCKYEGCYPLAKQAFAEMLSNKNHPQTLEELYRIWLEVVSRFGSVEELEEATFVLPCIIEKMSQSVMQVSMEFQLQAAEKRRAAGMPERQVGKLDCEAFRAAQTKLIAAGKQTAPATPAEEVKKAE